MCLFIAPKYFCTFSTRAAALQYYRIFIVSFDLKKCFERFWFKLFFNSLVFGNEKRYYPSLKNDFSTF